MNMDRDEIVNGLPEALLNRAGYATGVFDPDTLGHGPPHRYIVRAYDVRARTPDRREREHVVEAQSAEHAIHIVAKRHSFTFTRNEQNSSVEATRDNAHFQVDPRTGFVGFAARRK